MRISLESIRPLEEITIAVVVEVLLDIFRAKSFLLVNIFYFHRTYFRKAMVGIFH